ncbi:putative Translationally controlled tumor protein [Seiridium cardinale]
MPPTLLLLRPVKFEAVSNFLLPLLDALREVCLFPYDKPILTPSSSLSTSFLCHISQASLRFTVKMIIYKDIVTGSELISDSYDLKEVDGILFEADCAMISVGGESFDTGANASAEEAEEGTEDGIKKVNNVIHSFQLQPMEMDKKQYTSHIKGYIKVVKAHMDKTGASEEEKEAFKTKGQDFLKRVLKNFGDYETYIGESGVSDNDDQQVVLLNYREDGVTPFFTFWKHGLKGEKV